MTIDHVVLAVGGFLLGSLPFSVWIGRLALGVDIRDYGDGNPGTFNVIRAGGLKWGGLALMLDISKGAVPAGLATQIFRIDGIAQIIIALSPILGHAFSPFLAFRGGKAIAATAGALIGISLIELPLVFAVILVFWYTSLTSSGWAVMFTLICLLFYALLVSGPVEWVIFIVLMLMFMAFKHRDELIHRPRLKLSPLLRPFIRAAETNHDDGDSLHDQRPDRH
ncbi:MAG: glycerol-3-phosphate acyltransferase [Chloroflexota bacterium]